MVEAELELIYINNGSMLIFGIENKHPYLVCDKFTFVGDKETNKKLHIDKNNISKSLDKIVEIFNENDF